MNVVNFIKKYYEFNQRKLKYRLKTKYLKYSNIYNFLINYYNDSNSMDETLYRISKNINIHPKCYCGNNIKFYHNRFLTYCSIKCQRNDPENIQKYKNTCILKYGVDNPAKANTTIQKAKLTCNIKYGGNSPMQSNIIKNKHYNALKKNNSFNKSKPEEQSYVLLKEKYPDVIRQYKSKLYPFACDFYIPSLDLYIECNYHWTHGGKLFENTENDKVLLDKWKSKNTKFYNKAIETWTNLDVRKYNIAKENNLNYIIFYNINELQDWIND